MTEYFVSYTFQNKAGVGWGSGILTVEKLTRDAIRDFEKGVKDSNGLYFVSVVSIIELDN